MIMRFVVVVIAVAVASLIIRAEPIPVVVAAWTATTAPGSTYYFAIGSNLMPSTMTCLRNLSPQSATAAILPDYRLAFDIAGGGPLEPSAASARSCPGRVLHGVLYELNDADFRALSASEGVPFVYRWQDCWVIPYQGDGDRAGATALRKWQESSGVALPRTSSRGGGGGGDDAVVTSIRAVVLTKSRLMKAPTWSFLQSNRAEEEEEDHDIPPSPSYLSILQRGARLWQMDECYQTALANIKTADGVAGVSGLALALAELINPRTDLDLWPKTR